MMYQLSWTLSLDNRLKTNSISPIRGKSIESDILKASFNFTAVITVKAIILTIIKQYNRILSYVYIESSVSDF